MSQFLRTIAALLITALPAIGQAQKTDAHQPAEIRPDLIYHNYCSVCHGDRGDGRSRARNSLNPPPADFTTPQAREMYTRPRMILALQYGRPGTAMTAWTTQLSQKEIEAVVDYILDTMVPPADGRAYQEAGSEPKKLLWYDAEHGLNGEAVRDRHAWLAEQIGIRKPLGRRPRI